MHTSGTEAQAGPEIAGVVIPWTHVADRPTENRIDETRGLVEALGCELRFCRPEQIRKPNPAYLLSGGLLETLKQNAEANNCSIIVVDASLTPVQQRNLERELGTKVIDRTGLILEIFGLRALTREGRLQVELARLLYERSRLVRTWTHLERQRGGRGFLGGPGETQLESDKRMIDRQVAKLRRDLEDVRRTRAVQRSGRRRGDTPTIALVGYTNSGKSTLFNRLSGADVLAKDMPFATLDPTIRKATLPVTGEVALIDTVGFITDLPTHLVDSFRATLEEILEADLLVHVRDMSSGVEEEQKRDVLDVLHSLGASHTQKLPRIVEAWNKVDLLPNFVRASLTAREMTDPDCPGVCISAMTGEGIDRLLALLDTELSGGKKLYTLVADASDGALRAWLHAHNIVKQQAYDDAGQTEYQLLMSEKERGQLSTAFPRVTLTVAS